LEKRTSVLLHPVVVTAKGTPAGVPVLQKLFVGVELAVFAGVVERDVAVGAFFFGVDFATVEGLGIDVNADGALIEFG
jgi:hypothetical protein